MRAASGTGGCWPSEDQILLLRAGLLEADEAGAVWARWRAVNTPDTADAGSLRLLPLVYRNLRAADLDPSDLSTLKGTYRAAWFRNQLLFKRAAEALHALREAGIETMLLKGLALTVAHYRDAGVRPMDDVDVLVPWHDAGRALAVLAEAGWLAQADGTRAGEFGTVHAHHLQDGHGRSLDLHRYALARSSSDDEFWSASVESDLLGVPTRTLCPADQLLHAVAHGAEWNAIPPVRWLADAATIERSAGPELDWDRLVAEATRRRLTVAVSAALEQLAVTVDFPVPPRVLGLLRGAPKAPLEAWVHRAATRPAGGGGRLPVVLDSYRRRSRLDRSLRPVAFLMEHLGVRSRRELAGRLVRKSAQAALTQTAMRVAPALVGSCPGCARVVVRLRPAGSRLCEHCARAAD